LRPEQWLILPQMIRGQLEAEGAVSSKQNH
jgi:hypothetical protein